MHHSVNWLPVAGLDKALAALDLKPDLEGTEGDHDLSWIRRETDRESIYFLSNQGNNLLRRSLTFRQTGRTPEFWEPLDGSMERANSQPTPDGRTSIEVALESGQSRFVVFRDAATAPSFTQAQGEPLAINGPWQVTFEKNLGAPESITLDKLDSLSEHPEAGLKYFSGIATYRTTFNRSQIANPKSYFLLDLGEVHHIARVRLNGQEVANLWCPPYRAEIPAAAFKAGENTIELEVAIPWANRLIGDEQLPPDAPRVPSRAPGTERYTEIPEWVKTGGKSPNGRVTFVTATTADATKDAPLQPSGLLGPVTLRDGKIQKN